MERLQLVNGMLSFCMVNLAQEENTNFEDDVNERDDDIMAIDQGSPPSQLEPEVNEVHVTSDIDDI